MLKHLLVPLDSSTLAECVLPHTCALARAFQSQVTLLRVLAAPSTDAPVDPFDWQLQKAEAEVYLDAIAARLQRKGVTVETVVIEGDPAAGVIDYARRHLVDLIILSSHGASGLTRWHIGSVVQKVLFHSYLSILLVRAHQPVAMETECRYQRILAPLDGSQRAECALPVAAAVARSHNADLLLAHVLRSVEMPRKLPISPKEQRLAQKLKALNREHMMRHMEQLQSLAPGRTEVRLLEDEDVAAALHELTLTEQIDLVVLSAHGYGGGRCWLYGSVAINLIIYGATPLLLIQDLVEADRTPTPAIAAQSQHDDQLYMPSDRFRP